jgi:prepilin-type N-terminal cleavage/methylation domain-containing protein
VHNDKAFSLIELIVVISIFAILVAVASPSYKDYRTKTKILDGMMALDQLKKLSLEYYGLKGKFPTLKDIRKVNTDFATESLSWGDMGPDGWDGGDSKSAYVEVQFSTDTVPGQVAPRLALLAKVAGSAVAWTCYTYDTSDANVDYSISTKFLPAECSAYPVLK